MPADQNVNGQIGQNDVVISAESKEIDLARHLKSKLLDSGARNVYCYAEDQLPEYHDQFKKEWHIACRGDPFFVVLYSQGYRQSEWCAYEYNYLNDLLFPK